MTYKVEATTPGNNKIVIASEISEADAKSIKQQAEKDNPDLKDIKVVKG